MREYKFRGKRIDTGDWVYGKVLEGNISTFIVDMVNTLNGNIIFSINWHLVDPSTVGQCTGIKDSKRTAKYPEGQEIYKGDYIKDTRGLIYLVFWDENECAFKLDYKYYHHKDKDECHSYLPMYSRKGEVIGNQHDNPELLEVTK